MPRSASTGDIFAALRAAERLDNNTVIMVNTEAIIITIGGSTKWILFINPSVMENISPNNKLTIWTSIKSAKTPIITQHSWQLSSR